MTVISGRKKFRRYGTNSLCFEGFSPHCDLDLENRDPNCLHGDTPGHDDTPTCQVALRKVHWFRRFCQDQLYIFPDDLNPHCDLDLEHTNPKLSHNIWLVVMRHLQYTKFGCKRFRTACVIFWGFGPTLWPSLTLRIGTQTRYIFRTQVWHTDRQADKRTTWFQCNPGVYTKENCSVQPTLSNMHVKRQRLVCFIA